MYKSDTMSERNLQDMKRKILEQIDRTIQESPLKVRGASQLSNGVSPSQGLSTADYSSNLRNTNNNNNNYNTNYNNNPTNASEVQDESSAVNLSKNLRSLKSQILEKERAQEESVHRLKSKTNVMNEEVNDLKSKLAIMSETVKSRDRTIGDLEAQLSDTRNHFVSRQARENVLEKTSEDMHNTILHLKTKMSQRKSQISEIKEEMQRQERAFNDEKRRLVEDMVNLERTLAQITERLDQEIFKSNETEKLLERARLDLQSRDGENERLQMNQVDKSVMELSHRLSREQELSREMRLQNQLQEKKILEQERQLMQFEDKLQKSRKKYEEDKLSLLGDRKKETDKRKQKNRKLKVDLRALEEKANELAGDGAELRSEKDRLSRAMVSLQQELALKNAEIATQKQQIAGLHEDVDTLKHSLRDSDLLLKREQSEYRKLDKELKGFGGQMKARNDQLGEYEYELEKQQEVLVSVENDLNRQMEINRQQQDLILKIERQNQFLTDMQNRDIDKLEERVSQVNSEAVTLRKENEGLRAENTALKSELAESDRDSATNREKANKYRKQVALLKNSLTEADEKLRELIYQKHNQIRNDRNPVRGYADDDDEYDDDDDSRVYHN